MAQSSGLQIIISMFFRLEAPTLSLEKFFCIKINLGEGVRSRRNVSLHMS